MSAAAPVSSPEPRMGLEPLGPLAARLSTADRILQKERSASLLLRAWPWFTGLLAAALMADVVLHLTSGARLGIDVAMVLLVLLGGARYLWLALGKRNTFEHVARTLETRHPRLGSKLINVLQLRAQTQDPALAPLTRELAGMAIGGYVEELRNEPIEQLARTTRVQEDAKRAALGLLGFAALLAILFDITRTEIPRFFDPFGDHPPYSFTRLEITDPSADGTAVVYNENLVVTAKSSGHRPAELYLSWFPAGHPEQTATLPMFDRGDRGFTQQVENVKSDLVVFVHTKNQHALSRQRHVGVILTPRLEKAWVKITPPAYTGLGATEKPFEFKTVKALEGSAIEFRFASNRPLGSGHITVSTDSGVEPVTMTPGEEKQVIGRMVAKKPAQLKFSIVDRDGYPSQETWEAALIVTHDLPPDVQVTNPPNDSFVAMDFKAEPAIEASDDYGLKTLRIHTAHNGTFGEPKVIDYDRVTLHTREIVTFDFKTMGLQSGDTVSLFAEAIDNAPEPHIARSKTVTFTVISTEEYNDFLRERTDISDIEAKYAKLVNDMRDLIEQQKKVGEEIAALQKQLAAAKSDADKAAVQKKLDDLLAQQNALNAKLNKLADTMENFVRDQPLYDIEAELKNTLAEKAQEIRDSTQANAEDLQKVAPQPPEANGQQPPPAGGQPQPPQKSPPKGQQASGQPSSASQQPPSQKMLDDFKQASDEQLARLGATEQETENEVLKPLEDMSLMQEIIKDINHYKDLYAAQQELAKQAQAYNRPGPLTREDQLALKDLAAQEKSIGEDLDSLEQKLWDDGKAAQEKFPKAAESAQTISQRMGDLKLQTLAHQATGEMVAGNGSNGAALSETLRGEMEKLFSQCKSKDGEMDNELDQYLSIQRGMNPAANFKQMMQCRKLGTGGSKPGNGSEGNGGRDGYAIISGQNPNVLGNEALPSHTDKAQNDGHGKNKTPPNVVQPEVALDKSDVVKGVNPLNRESEAVQSETIIQQYSDLVEEYFKALTKSPKKEAKSKAKP
ncbi:MAG: hypothetical protein ABJF10_18845 [Chthoniobacter sp.]|uniref:hypothetical protein n=1 Tax=Chthoniobacter sp. TaxID=2510640 RepID=UPI0032A24007